MVDEEIRKAFAKNLNAYLELNGYNQADLARHMKVSTATTAKWCTGQTMPRIDKIQSICNWLDVKKADLLDSVADNQKSINDRSQLTSFDDQLLKAYHSASDEAKSIVRYTLKLPDESIEKRADRIS